MFSILDKPNPTRFFLFSCFFLFSLSRAQAQIDSAAVNRSPYGVVYNHLYYLQPDSYDPERAALSFLQAGEQGPELAIRLKQILDGEGLYIDLNRLPTAPDYFDSVARAPLYFPDPNEPLIYLERIDSSWYYSRTTVASIPLLYERVYPLGNLGATWFRAPEWQIKAGGLALWKWVALLLNLLFAVALFVMVRAIGRMLIFPWLKKRYGLSSDVRNAGKMLSRVTGLWAGVRLFIYLLPMIQLPPLSNAWMIKGLNILGAFFLIIMANQLVRILFFKLQKVTRMTESTLDDQLLPVMRRMVGILVWAFGLFYILDYLHVNVTALLAGISIGGLAIALAAQDTVKNFFGSLMIFLDKPFQIGDWIHFNNIDGVVEEVGIRSTRIRTFANSLTYVPNAKLADAVVDNMGLRIYRRFKTDIGVTYDTPPRLIDLFVKGIREIILAHPKTRKDYFEDHLNSFGASSLNILLYTFFQAPNWSEELKSRHELMYAIIVLANDLGVRFAFPTQTLHVEAFPGQLSETPVPSPQEEAAAAAQSSLARIRAYFQESAADERPEKFKPLGGE